MPTLVSFDNEDDVTDFVRCKIESLMAQTVTEHYTTDAIDSNDSRNFRAASHKFAKLFNMPEEEKLVNCESFTTHKKLIEKIELIKKFYFNRLIKLNFKFKRLFV
jgi:hypothetical protein